MDRRAVVESVAELHGAEYIGQWNRLVSTTNWEKGRIIHQWRQALADAGAPPSDCSDEAWSQCVGGVSGQHAGRLRRVFARFAACRDQFPGLYWSHFQAALDWDDAEMWLEGAVRQSWSVNRMRHQRWEALGLPEELKPQPDARPVADDGDEDAADTPHDPMVIEPSMDVVREPLSPAGPDFGDEDAEDPPSAGRAQSVGLAASDQGDDELEIAEGVTRQQARPFEELPTLPDDLAEAFDSFKLAILRHKQDAWREVSADAVLTALDGLRQLVLAES